MESIQQKHRRLTLKLLLGVVLMFGFGFMLVPLYDVFCQVTGLNGKIYNNGPVTSSGVDESRSVRLQLIGINNEGMPWRFKPVQSSIELHPGKMTQTHFIAFNPTSESMVAQAVPSVAPSEAASYLHKINCFCFEQQPLNSGEQQEMPLVLMIDQELPAHIKTITLSYTLFDITRHQQAVSEDTALRRDLL